MHLPVTHVHGSKVGRKKAQSHALTFLQYLESLFQAGVLLYARYGVEDPMDLEAPAVVPD